MSAQYRTTKNEISDVQCVQLKIIEQQHIVQMRNVDMSFPLLKQSYSCSKRNHLNRMEQENVQLW